MDFKPNWSNRLARLFEAYMIIHMANCVVQDPMSISHATFSLTFSLSQFQYMHMVDKKHCRGPYLGKWMGCLGPFCFCIAFFSVRKRMVSHICDLGVLNSDDECLVYFEFMYLK
jgi:hypothetical protein